MADKMGNRVVLEKKEGIWIVNDRYKAYPAKVDVLLETMRSIRVNYPITRAEWDYVVRDLAARGIKVEIYLHGNSVPARVYYVGGTTHDGYGTYMITEINGKMAKSPYVVHVPGFRGNVRPRYFLNEDDWRDLTIFNFDIDDIASVSLTWYHHPDQSFTLIRTHQDSFYMPENTLQLPLFKTGILKFLDSFSFINAEALENTNPLKDSVLQQSPFLQIAVRPIKGKPVTVNLYHMAINKRSKAQFDEQGNPLPYDLDRYWATVDNGLGFVVVQDFVFGKIMRTRGDFIVQPEKKQTSRSLSSVSSLITRP